MPVLLLDMDDTLVVEEASVVGAFMDTCRLAEKRSNIRAEELYSIIRQTSRELWHGAPVRQYCLDIGISSWEALHGDFNGDSPELAVLRRWTPDYRLNSWYYSLQKCGVEDRELGAYLVDIFIANMRGSIVLFDDTLPCLCELSKHYTMVLLSNGAPGIQREKINLTGIGGFFTDIIISGEVGCGKPDPLIYKLVLSRLKISRDEAVMVGDSLETDIIGAASIGIKTIWLNRRGEPRDGPVTPDYEISGLHQLLALLTDYFP